MPSELPGPIQTMVRELVGRRSGVVRDLKSFPAIDGDAKLFFVGADIADGLAQYDGPRSGAAGAGLTREAAIAAALGEGLERRGAMAPRDARFPIHRRKDWSVPTCDPAGIASLAPEIYASRETPFERYRDEQRIAWVPAIELATRNPAMAPAMAVYLGWPPQDGQGKFIEPVMAPVTSTGLACGTDFDTATRMGLYEVIERDALVLYWLTGACPRRLDQRWFIETAGDLLPPRDRVDAFDLTTDIGIPTAMVVCRGEGPDGPLLAVGSATRSSWREAARKAALEASQCRVYARQLRATHAGWQPGEHFEHVVDFSCHARLYSLFPEWIPAAFGFLYPTPYETHPLDEDTSAHEASLEHVVARLAELGHQAFVVDLTPVEAKVLGWHVVRALVPSLMPLHGHHWLPHLGHPRWIHSAAALSQETRRAPREWPHPFA